MDAITEARNARAQLQIDLANRGFLTDTQVSFSKLWGNPLTGTSEMQSSEAAKKARDEYFWRLKKAGFKAKRSVLTIRLGQPDGRVCDVYYVNIYC